MKKQRYSKISQKDINFLENIVGKNNISIDKEKLKTYSCDEVSPIFWEKEYIADVLVFPTDERQISKILKYANKRLIPVVPRGAGTGLSGGCVPAYGGIIISFEKMNKIIEIDTTNMVAVVEPGVVTAEITKEAEKYGLLYAGDPCSGDASFIGGNVAENAGGNKVIKYGTTGDNVLGLEVVLPDGSITWFGGKRKKDVTGLDLLHLIIGSEGTLGVVTKIILKLVPKIRFSADLFVPFKKLEDAVCIVSKIAGKIGITPYAIEFIDKKSMELAERYLDATLPGSEAEAFLIIGLEENDEELLADEYEAVGDLCLENGALQVYVADDKNSKEELWKARKCLGEALMHFYSKYSKEDLSVPTSNVPLLLKALDKICNKYDLHHCTYGHIGDGNMHINLLIKDDNPNWKEILEKAKIELYKETKELGGTLTGEHGVGLKRKRYLPIFLDSAQIELIKRIKLAFDPNLILNPGKIVDIP